jgi:hypothetical protein
LSWHESRKLRRKKLDINVNTIRDIPSTFREPAIPPALINMLRTVAIRALRASSTRQVARQFTNSRPQSITFSFRPSRIAPTFAVSSVRCYSASAGLSKEEVQGRIMDLLKNFDKVCFSRVRPQEQASLTDHRLPINPRYIIWERCNPLQY